MTYRAIPRRRGDTPYARGAVVAGLVTIPCYASNPSESERRAVGEAMAEPGANWPCEP